MILLLSTFFAVLVIASSLDRMAQPNKYPTHRSTFLRARAMGLPFRVLPLLLIFGCALAVTGRVLGAGVLSIVAIALLVLGSNLKRGLLDEPLLFSDAVLVKACFQHPRFYVDALPLPARVAVLSGLSATVLTVGALFVYDLTHLTRAGGSTLLLRIIGLLFGVSSLLLLHELARTSLPRRLMPLPDYNAAMPTHGFLATTSISWLLWLQDRHRPLSSHSRAARREPPREKARSSSSYNASPSPIRRLSCQRTRVCRPYPSWSSYAKQHDTMAACICRALALTRCVRNTGYSLAMKRPNWASDASIPI